MLDIGAGSGLTSECLLARHPRCEAIVVEPSKAMLDIARRNLRGRAARFFEMGLDGAPLRDIRVVAALASASMHFLDLDRAFGTLADLVVPGGYVAFNLWWHHWEETADCDCMSAWESIERSVCEEAGLQLPSQPSALANRKTRAGLNDAFRKHGFQAVAEARDDDASPVAFGLEFAAMDANWPAKGRGPTVRNALIAEMHARAQGIIETLVSTRFLVQRPRSAA